MRPKYLVGIIIGILLLYLGFMGASGIGLTWSSGTLPSIENFNDIGGWQCSQSRSPAISPAGQVWLQAAPAGSTSDTRSSITSISAPGPAIEAVSVGSSYTIILRMKADSWAGSGFINFQVYGRTYMTSFNVYQSKVQSYLNKETWTHALDSDWHNYTMITTLTGAGALSVDFYVDTAKLGTSTSAFTGGDMNPRISLDAWDGLSCHIDFVDVEPGKVLPTGGGSPGGQASLTINAVDSSGSALFVSVTVNGIGPRTTPSTFGPFTPGTFQVVAPPTYISGSTTYGFTRWSNGETSPSINYNLQTDTTLTATYTAGQPGPSPTPSDNGGVPDILGNMTAFIRNIFNNGQVRQLEMGIGALTAAISGIIFILPASKRYYQPAPPPRYYG